MDKTSRLISGSELRVVFKEGRKVFTTNVVLNVLPNSCGQNRMAFCVSKRLGKAVLRNRIKRLFREAYRRNHSGLKASYDIVVVVRKALSTPSYREAENKLWGALKKAGLLKDG